MATLTVCFAGCEQGAPGAKGDSCTTNSDCVDDLICEDAVCIDNVEQDETNDREPPENNNPDDQENGGEENENQTPETTLCGNGILDPGEDCDPGKETIFCNIDCTESACGDGVLNTSAGETCDDGDNNGKPKHCNFACNGTMPATCGNGVVEDGDFGDEACDDGEQNGTYGHCNEDCTGPTEAVCGNGVVEGDEACDPGAAGESADCNPDCTQARCGDGIVNLSRGETCDDGEHNGQVDQCNTTCDGYVLCGNGERDPGEVCDDGDTNGQEGFCNEGCSGVGDAICGNGAVEDGEACDPGAAGETPTCTNICTVSTCGDGIVNASADEACDDAGDSFACTADCQAKPVAYRIDSAKIIDPHLHVLAVLFCADITNSGLLNELEGGVNGELQRQLDNTKTLSGKDVFNMTLALIMRPFEQRPNTDHTGTFETPICDSPLVACQQDVSGILVPTTFHNHAHGQNCLPPAEHLGRNPDYTGMTTPSSPCFTADNDAIELTLKDATLRLTNVKIAARYADAPASRLEDGILMGFLSKADAEAASFEDIPVLGNVRISDLLGGGTGTCGPKSDLDVLEDGTQGWWFYLNFTAQAAESWNE